MKIQIRVPVKQRNWVAKNNYNRAQIMRDRTQYQRRPKHQGKEWE